MHFPILGFKAPKDAKGMPTKGREYTYPVWGTQGGGLVREVGGIYVFVEKPDCPGLDVGDTMPDEWGVIPANQHARTEMRQYEFDLD